MGDVSGAAFWLFIAAIAIAGIWREVALRRETEITLRLAIEKGQQLDPAVIDKMLRQPRKLGVEGLLIAGGVTLATGLGLPVMGYFIGRSEGDWDGFYAMVGAGFLILLVGIALLILSALLNKRRKAEEAQRAAA
jgi:hypothetical protein